MILALLLQVAVPTVQDDIVVIGQKLASWRASCTTTRGVFACRTRKSSGDREIDAIGNAAMEACYPAIRPRYDAAQAKGVPAAQRRTMMAAANDAYGRCMVQRRDVGISALADRRAAARLGS